MKKDAIYLNHILDAIKDIETSLSGLTLQAFKKDKDKMDATVRRLEIIGEAGKNLSTSLRRKYPSVQWKKIVGTRDIMIHAYFKVDFNLVWDIFSKDLPILKQQIQEILSDLA